MTMHIISVIADDLSPEHLLAAIRHWASKFEQEILHVDGGPAHFGEYSFEHDGKPTTVKWDPAEPPFDRGKAPQNGLVELPNGDLIPAETPQARRRDDDTITRPVDPAADPTSPAETAQHAAEQSGSTAADVAASVAPDLV